MQAHGACPVPGVHFAAMPVKRAAGKAKTEPVAKAARRAKAAGAPPQVGPAQPAQPAPLVQAASTAFVDSNINAAIMKRIADARQTILSHELFQDIANA